MAAGLLGFGSVLLAGVWSPAIAATSTWSTPVNLSATGGNGQGPQISVDAEGNAFAVWNRFDGGNTTVQTSASRDGGLTWSAPLDLSAPGVDAVNPQLSVDSSGNIIVVWNGSYAGNHIVQSSSSTDGGETWSTPTDIYSAGGTPYSPKISVDPLGTAYAIWHHWNGSNEVVQTASSTDLGLTWSAPVDLSAPGGDSDDPQISVDSGGSAIAVWKRFDGYRMIVQSRSSSDGGLTWSNSVDLSPAGGSAGSPQISVDADGTAHAIWYQWTGGIDIVQSAASTDGGVTWSTPMDLSDDEGLFTSPQISVNPEGTAIAVWVHFDGVNTFTFQSSTSTDGGVNWSTPVNLTAVDGYAGNPEIAVNAEGTAVAVWARLYGLNTFVVQSSWSGDRGVTWSTPVDLSGADNTAGSPQISIDVQGNAIAVWVHSDGNNMIVRASSLASPSLADTGILAGTNTTALGVGAVLLTAGSLTLVVVRQRLARA